MKRDRAGHLASDMPRVRRAIRFGSVLLGLLTLTVFGLSSLVPYTDYLWYAHDVRQPDVFAKAYGARGTLLLLAFFPTWAIVYFSLRKALSIGLVYLQKPDTLGQALLSNAVSWVKRHGPAVVRFAAPTIALLTALGFANEWQTWLLAQHPQLFGQKDPTFGLDLSFFVFTLPWLRALANYAFAVLVLTTLLTIGVYAGTQALAMLARIELGRPHVRQHISLLVGLTLLAYAAQAFLKTYEIGLIEGPQFTGAGYAASQSLVPARIFAFLLAVVAAGTVVGGWAGRRPYAIPLFGGAAAAAFYALAVIVYPATVQRFSVDPDRLAKEGPFAERALRMTRYAYGLDRIAVRDFEAKPAPSPESIETSRVALESMRLWDPTILRQSLEALQSIGTYYTFHDVDVDRYQLNGKSTMVMLAPRDVSLERLSPAARNWTNLRLRYTHGYGVTVATVGGATADGDPELLAQGIPQTSEPSLPITRPQIYFSDTRTAAGTPFDEPALVRSRVAEFDYPQPNGAAAEHRWESDRGVPLSGFLARLAFAARMGDGNLLVSGNITPGTRLLMRRNVVERASKVYPFLRFDLDPYLVILNGRLIWILDGYTTTDMIPYARHVYGRNGRLNYIRNSVKATVDAYTGETAAYATEPNEPLLRAYRRIYPGLVRPMTELPAGLREHFRYPEDLFTLQSAQLEEYHVTDPTVFLSNGDPWEVAYEVSMQRVRVPIRAYYVQMRLPGEAREGFQLILPFTPRGKPNMSGWLAAGCDPDQYGRLALYRFSKGSAVPGPELMETKFDSTPEVSNLKRLYASEQSEILVGNLLVVPVGDSVMYVEPLFLRSRTQGASLQPRLFKVLLALRDKVAVADTYSEALTRLLGTAPEVTPAAPPSQRPNGPTPQRPPDQAAGVREALGLLDQAEAALRRGDFARYGELQKAARQRLEELAK